MKKIILTLAIVLAAHFLAAPAIAEIDGTPLPTLRGQSEVDDNYIRLGDLFANLPENQRDISVAYAPKPGRRAVFDALWLYRVARHHRLKWRPMSRLDQAIISRPSQIIGQSDIEQAISAALTERGAPNRFQIEFTSRNLTLHIPQDATNAIRIEDLQYQPGDDRFAAILGISSDMASGNRTRVSGRIHPVVDVPVLNRRMESGDVISENDIEWLELRQDRIERNTIVDQEQLVGMSPRRALQSGAIVRAGAVRRPIIVEKNSLVNMYLTRGALRLTAQGRALEAGSEGDVIRIQNTTSKTTIEATVTASGAVTVAGIGGRLTN